jgi:hypothetical protein
MRPGLQSLVLALSLVVSAQSLSSQPPLDPPSNVELQEAYAEGTDLVVTLSWSADGATLPAGAALRLLDSQGLEAASVPLAPVHGDQTLTLSGGVAPLPSDSGTWPLSRRLQLVSASAQEIVLEADLAIDSDYSVQILVPIWPWPFLTGRQCYLHVSSLTCDDPEDKGGDEPYLSIGGFGGWVGPTGVQGVKRMAINQTYLLCDTCQNIQKSSTITLKDLDDPPFDPHDTLGSVTVSGCSTVPLRTVKFSGSNYTYWLKYRVACFEDICD